MTPMSKPLTMAILFLATCTTFGESCSVKNGPTCDPRGGMALQYMYDHFGIADSAVGFYIDGDYGPQARLRLEQREHKFEALEKWAKTLQAPDRGAYLGAIEYYERGTKEAYTEWHTHSRKREQEAYKEYLKRCAEAEKKSAVKTPMPKPPASLIESR